MKKNFDQVFYTGVWLHFKEVVLRKMKFAGSGIGETWYNRHEKFVFGRKTKCGILYDVIERSEKLIFPIRTIINVDFTSRENRLL